MINLSYGRSKPIQYSIQHFQIKLDEILDKMLKMEAENNLLSLSCFQMSKNLL